MRENALDGFRPVEKALLVLGQLHAVVVIKALVPQQPRATGNDARDDPVRGRG